MHTEEVQGNTNAVTDSLYRCHHSYGGGGWVAGGLELNRIVAMTKPWDSTGSSPECGSSLFTAPSYTSHSTATNDTVASTALT